MIHDLAVGLHQRLRVERRLPVQHLVHADAQRPPVALGPVPPLAVFHRLEGVLVSLREHKKRRHPAKDA